jgi:hypothetical protein
VLLPEGPQALSKPELVEAVAPDEVHVLPVQGREVRPHAVGDAASLTPQFGGVPANVLVVESR